MDEARVRGLFGRFRDCLARVEPKPQLAQYTSFEPARFDLRAMAFLHLVEGQRVLLANSVNELCYYTSQLRAWADLLDEIPENEHFDVVVELVLPVAFFALGAPYMIKQRFCTSIAELSHQANQNIQPGWKDDADLHDINFKVARKLAGGWDTWPVLEAALAGLNSEQYQVDVYDFRNEFHHGFPRQIELGLTPFVERKVGANEVAYGFGAYPPLKLRDVLDSLGEQCRAALAVFNAWLDLVLEQRASFPLVDGADG